MRASFEFAMERSREIQDLANAISDRTCERLFPGLRGDVVALGCMVYAARMAALVMTRDAPADMPRRLAEQFETLVEFHRAQQREEERK
jgi:hypothetical protein